MAAPQLRLDVSLNLSGFRGEIQKLTNIAQSEFVPKINIKFNRRTLDTELNNLQAAIKRRVYRVEIGGNIDKLPDKIRGLKEQLSSLESFKIDLGIGAVKSLSKKDAKDIANGLRAQILGEQTKLYVPVSIKPSVTREDVRNFKNTVKSKLTGLSVDVKANVQGAGFAGTKSGAAGLMEYMQKEGLLGKTASGMTMQMGKDSGEIKRQLNEAVQSAEKIKSVFDGVAKNIATTGKSIANIQGKRIGLQNVPLMAGSVEKRVERSASAIGSTTSFDTLKALYPEISKTIVSFAALRGQIQQNASKLSGFSLIIGLAAFAGVPLAKSIVKLTGSADSFTKLLDKLGPKLEIAFAKAASNILNTASSRLLSGGSVAGLLPAAYRGIGPSAGPAGLLPPAYRGIEPSRSAGALPPAYRGLPFGFDFKGLPPGGSGGDKGGSLGPTIQQMREQLFSSVRIAEARVREIFDIVADFDSRQKAAGQARLDKAVQDFVKGLEDITRRAILRGGVRQVNVADLGGAVRPALPSGRSPLMLPPAGGTTATGRIRVSTGAYLGQPGFMQAPSVPSPAGGGGTPPLPPRGGRGGGAFGGMQFNMPQLPGAGLVREIGEEFGFAAKQVLLFGTAYKALAFLQGFPAQVGDAVGALQSFRNTIKEISPSAQEAADSSQFILDIVDKYNTPLQSARDGFVKLYASMQPAGFSGDEIRDLFLGISQTAATFGMSADKVDRVNYAFAQMASKGQVMSEELKGQLGDVLPGAMAIFAEAAGFKGPEAITKFSKALEDGAYKGAAMKVLLTNVGSIMRKEFGPGAEGAARTFQGVMNRMQNSLKLLYETFEPVAVGFLNSVVMPMTSGLKTVTDGLNAFFTGAATKTSGGFAIAQELEKLRPTFDGIRENAGQLIPVLGQIAQVALGVGKAFLQIASNPFVGYVARVYLNILALTTAINILNLRALIPMIANFARSLYALVAFAIQCVSTGSAVQRLGMAVQVTGLMLRTFFATTGIGLVLVGIGLLTERFLSMNQALADTKAKAAGAADAIRAMSQTEARQASQQYDRQAQSLKGLSREIEEGKMKGKAWIEVTKEQAEALKSAGVTVSDVRGSLQVQPMRVGGAYQKVEGLAAEAKFRVKGLDYQDKQVEQQANIAPIPPGNGEDEASKKKTSLESYYSLQDQLAKAQTQADIDRLEAAFEHARAIINAEYDLKEAKANSFQKKAIAFQKEIFAITSEQDAALFKNRNKVLAAAGSVSGGAPSGSGGSLAGMAQYITGDPSHPSYKPDHGTIADYHDHLAFASREAAIEAYNKLTKAGIKVTEFQGFGQGVTGPHSGPGSAHHKGLAMDVPGYQWGGSGAIGAREFAGSARVRATLGIGGGTSVAPGKVAPSIKRDELANQQVALTAREANASAVEKEAEAIAKLEIATANYVQSLVPTAEQTLQNQLLQQRITLTQNSFSPEILKAQLAFAEQELQVAESIKISTEEINKLTAAGGNNAKRIKALTDANNQLKANLPVSAIQLLTKAIDDQVLSLVQRTKTAERDAADQERVNSLIIGGMTRQSAEAKVTAENLRNDYNKALEEATKQVEIAAAAEEVLAAARRLGKKETAEQTAEYNRLAQALKDAKDKKDALEGRAPQVGGAATGIKSSVAPKTASSYIADGLSEAQERLAELTNTGYQVVQAANSIGNAFGEAFKGVITGSMTAQEALAGMFRSIADHFVDMVAQMIAEYLKMALIKGLMSIVGGAAGAIGGGLSSGFNAGTSSAIDTGAAGWANSFGTSLKFANGGIAPGSFQAFANGGIVTGPTLGLVGEGRYNEAVIPLPDGKSVPVKLSGSSGSDNGPTGRMQSAMARYGANARGESAQASNGNESDGGTLAPGGLATIDVRYSIERINNVEYVTASQFQEGMRQAAQQGAAQGEQRTLRRLQQSPSTRKRIGV